MDREQEIKIKQKLFEFYGKGVSPRRILYLGEPRVLQNPFYGKIRKHPGTILDAGCGTGDDTRQFLKDGFSPIGVDMNGSGFQLGYEWYGNAEEARHLFRAGDVRKMEFGKEAFQYSYSGSLIHTLKTEENVRAYLSETWRTLVHGGQLFGSTVGIENQSEKRRHERIFLLTENELRDLLHSAGFGNVQLRSVPNKKPDLRGLEFLKIEHPEGTRRLYFLAEKPG